MAVPLPMKTLVERSLVAPSKIAKFLDWRRNNEALLSIHIGKGNIDVAVTNHPESSKSTERLVQPLPSIPMACETRENQKVLKTEVIQELLDIIDDFRICGVLVSWPVQKEGWAGASCGKTLHFLEQIVQHRQAVDDLNNYGNSDENSVLPLCLWNGHHWATHEDEWGRIAQYGIPAPSGKTEHVASQEQYIEDGMVASDIATDFIRYHWPSINNQYTTSSSTARRIDPSSMSTRRKPWALNSLLANAEGYFGKYAKES